MFYPNLMADHCSIRLPSGRLSLPSQYPNSVYSGDQRCLRVVLRGGFFFDAPGSAIVRNQSRAKAVANIAPGDTFCSPARRRLLQTPCKLSYDYLYNDNQGTQHRAIGVEWINDNKAEILGWLVGDGTINNASQSVRFANSDVWCLKHLERLVTKEFPTVKVTWYSKQTGFDLTMTGGIHNPLRHFIRKMCFVEGFPTAASLFHESAQVSFLRGLWGADGWMSDKKGGNDVDMGLRRGTNTAFSSLMRDIHASHGLRGQRRDSPTKNYPDAHRLIFSGYANYRLFVDSIGQLRDKKLKYTPVVRTSPRVQTFADHTGDYWYETPVLKILRLPHAVSVYEIKP